MKTYETTTNIAPIICVDTYNSDLSWEWMWEPYAEADREEGYFVCDEYDFAKYKETIVEFANSIFKEVCDDGEMLQEYGVVSVKATNMGSPREYNFYSDWLDLEVTVEDDFLDRAEKAIMAPENREAVDEYMREHWRSRDGYISSMPADCIEEMPEVFRMLREEDCGYDDKRAFGTVFMLLMVIKGQQKVGDISWGPEYWSERLVEDIRCNRSIGDFCTVLDWEEANELYGDYLFYDRLDRADDMLREGLEKYRSSGVSKESVERAEKEVKARLKKLTFYRDSMRAAVEQWHPGRPDAVRSHLDELKSRYIEEFGDCPTRAALGNPDLPGQQVMELQ